MSYTNFEKEEEKTRAENKQLLDDFYHWLIKSGLKENTAKKHLQNVDLYINYYLLYEECIKAKNGISEMNGFFNWFFPKKAMWSSQATCKASVASLKKFYKFLAEQEEVSVLEYQDLLSEVKNNMAYWLENYADENNW